ncbi:MAG: dephospho-CoA kinase, partial [Clostridia bacterium]|nr:dephospho-CoA kinase [Clostridia bacterium]
RCHEVWCAYLPPETQLKRLMARDKLTREEALARMGSQMPLAEKAARSTHLIDTSGSIEESAAKLKLLYNKVF